MKKYILYGGSVLLVILLVTICGFQLANSKFSYNDEHADGNTPGNLLNNGLFREYDGKIYFSNLKDDGKLYVMDSDFSNFKKLSNDKVNSINVAGKHIIYSRINNKKENNTNSVVSTSAVGIYRMDIKGKSTIELDNSAKGMVHLYGNTIYYQTFEKKAGYSFEKMDIEGKKKSLVTNDPIYPASIVNGTLYFTGFSEDHNLHKTDLSTMENETMLKGNYFHLAANGNYLYMIDIKDGYSICRTDLTGQSKETLVKGRTCTYNVTSDNKYLYYQLDNNEDNGLYRLNLETKANELLISGNFNNINVTKEYVFFTDMDEKLMYAVEIGDAKAVQSFNPVTSK